MKTHIELVSHDTIAVLVTAMKKTHDRGQKIRLKAIILRMKGKTPQEIAEGLVITDRSVTGWIRRYNKGGISSLATKQLGRPTGSTKWDGIHFKKLTKEIDKGGYWSIPRMQKWLSAHYGVNIPEQTIWYRMDQLNYSYKGARPHPTQGNIQKQESFKKGA